MVLRSKKTFDDKPAVLAGVNVEEMSVEEIELAAISLQNAKKSDHPEALDGVHPDVRRYFTRLVEEQPGRAIELLILTNRQWMQASQDLSVMEEVAAVAWYAAQPAGIRARVDAKVAALSDIPSYERIVVATAAVRKELKAAEQVKLPPVPPGLSAKN